MLGDRTLERRVGLALLPGRERADPAGAYKDPERLSLMVRDAFRGFGIGREHPDAPLREIIRPGDTVLLKPNWVLDFNQSNQGMECMVTHPGVLAAVLAEVMTAEPGRVIVGDAPIQLCRFDRLVTEDVRALVGMISNHSAQIVDFRRTVADSQDMSEGVRTDLRDESLYCLFDLGVESLLETVSGGESRFRITNYDPRLLAERHRAGSHQYLLCREAFEADVIIGLPKLKTHRKAGLTGALKNLVGLNGNKDFLPHHRRGSVGEGGDCYPAASLTLHAVEEALDRANRAIGTVDYQRWHDLAMRAWRRANRRQPTQVEGSWHGNDTIWRTVLDLNRLLRYGRADGTLSPVALRSVYSLTDAIVVGEAEGPMAPSPRVLGALTFASSSPAADVVHAGLLGFDWRRIPVIARSFDPFSYPLADARPESVVVATTSDACSTLEAAGRWGIRCQAPRTWAGHVELEAAEAA